ncbi:hypothetical protein DL89DRAFT_268335 [Linderina pennispora]|uniref:Uncharacterized protein n=1 Tax=Linderina pennispora TaxID=61395 RepID=A0A1Y1W5L4_9FUNG|nr:uncharacterized protein DL89DRAFT_268335 [Linderina pennispora]ORX68504.1 hypothetical protein DL89DRAFT_268335 [Linderina pennispora]
MTELLALARALDVRYHIVTFGFAVFMAGVVHVGAVACTPRDSTERQYSVNCVKEHVRCLDRLGKYFAFHFIMAKHIRAQLQTIEATDLRRQSAAMTASRPPAFPPTMSLAFPQMPTALAMDQAMPDLGLSGLAFLEQPQLPPVGQSESWFSSPGASLSNAPSVDLLSGLFGSPPAATPPPVLPSDAQSVIFGMQGMQGMQGMSGLASLGSLAELFSPSRDGSSSSTPLYPEKILNSSQLAPPRHQSTSRQHRTASTDDVNMANQSHSAAQSQADPAAPLRLTSPGGFQQFGSLPPFSPL